MAELLSVPVSRGAVGRRVRSAGQATLVGYLQRYPQRMLTLSLAVHLIDDATDERARKRVCQRLSRLVASGLLVRVKRGLYALRRQGGAS